MNYDCLIIGAGLSGLICGIKCAEEGLRTIIISGGMNALHFSSGSIDLMSYDEKANRIIKPYDFLKTFTKTNPHHPYAKVGIKTIQESLDYFKSSMASTGLELYNHGDDNHFHITGLGTMKTSYFSQVSVFNEKLYRAFKDNAEICILNFDGYRDFFSELTMEQIKKLPIFKNTRIKTGKVSLPYYLGTEGNLHEFRSIDLARVFNSERYLPRIADEIKRAAGTARIVSLPAFIGIENYKRIHQRLQEMTGLLIYEVPTLPPSILGMRLDRALKTRFAELGGELSAGDRVTGGEIIKGMLDHVHTSNYGSTRLSSNFYVLSTGSFFSGGLKSEFNSLSEPVFNLKLADYPARNKWYASSFFDNKSHPFLSYGVETTKNMNPYDSNNKPVKNLFCTGAILSGYNPIREGSGGGVAIATGYYAARKIIKEISK